MPSGSPTRASGSNRSSWSRSSTARSRRRGRSGTRSSRDCGRIFDWMLSTAFGNGQDKPLQAARALVRCGRELGPHGCINVWMSKKDNIDRVWDILEKVSVCMLTTQFVGGLRARPLEARPDRDAGLIFFVTDIPVSYTHLTLPTNREV